MKVCAIVTGFLFSFINNYSQHVIKSYAPTSGPIGTVVTINGLNFGSSASNTFVFLGAVRADIISINQTTIKVVVPLGSTFEPISVVVNNTIAYSAKPFTVTFSSDSIITSNSFIEKQRITTEHSPFNVVIGDIDGDKKPDLAIVNNGTGSLSLYRNISIDSTIAFEPQKIYSDLLSPQVLALADLNCDGKLDIAATSYGDDKLVIYNNRSAVGNFLLDQPLKLAASNYTREIAIRDLDLDGRADIVLSNIIGTISVFKNITTGTNISFGPKDDYATGFGPYGLAISDIDGDEKPDVIVTNKQPQTISIYRNKSANGSINFSPKLDFAAGPFPTKVGTGDFDNDGKDDLAVTGASGDRLYIFRNTSTINTISLAPPVTYQAGAETYNVAINDMNGDGKPDIVVTNHSEKSICFFLNKSNTGSISFHDKVNYPALATGVRGLALGDLDSDGRPEIVITNGYAGCCDDTTASIYQNKIGRSIILPPPSVLTPKIRVYPNPSNDEITIDTLSLNDGWQRMDLFSADGKFIRTYDLINKETITLKVNFLPAGMYFLILYDKGGKRTGKKFIKRL